jgi:rare lipoprotein A
MAEDQNPPADEQDTTNNERKRPGKKPLSATANQDYERDGKSYKIVQDASRFSQAGLAAIYDAEPGSNLTASGEAFDPMQLTAAHPTLPIPSYARITNLANGRMIVVRINDRGPYGNDRVISLSRAAADRLNTSNNTKVRIDPIIVAQDGSLSGPGMACTTVAKQTYALPARPDLSGGMGSVSSPSEPVAPQGDVRAISNDTLKSEDSMGAPVSSSGFLGAPTTLASGVLEGSEPPAAQPVVAPQSTAPVTAPASTQQNQHNVDKRRDVDFVHFAVIVQIFIKTQSHIINLHAVSTIPAAARSWLSQSLT